MTPITCSDLGWSDGRQTVALSVWRLIGIISLLQRFSEERNQWTIITGQWAYFRTRSEFEPSIQR
jgi:hypothetical protein